MRRAALRFATLAIGLGGLLAADSLGREVLVGQSIAAPARQEGIVRVQLTMQLFIAGPTDESEEAERLRERGRRALYNMAAKECDLLREVIARDCRLEAVNVNVNVQRQGAPPMQGYQVGGSMTFQITLK